MYFFYSQTEKGTEKLQNTLLIHRYSFSGFTRFKSTGIVLEVCSSDEQSEFIFKMRLVGFHYSKTGL